MYNKQDYYKYYENAEPPWTDLFWQYPQRQFEYDLLDIFIFDKLYFQSYFFLAPNTQVSYDKEESEALEEEKSIFNQATRFLRWL